MGNPRIAAAEYVLPEHRYGRNEVLAALDELWRAHHHNPERLRRLHDALDIDARAFALPLEDLKKLTSLGESNRLACTLGAELGAQALSQALSNTNVTQQDIDALFFTTETCISAPSIDAIIANNVGLRSDVQRTPMFGYGCTGGAVGIARMSDYLRAYPTKTAALVSVELCSLTARFDDVSIANMIAFGLFGDAAAAVIAVGAEVVEERDLGATHVLSTQSVLVPNTDRVLAFDLRDDGLQVNLSPKLPAAIGDAIPPSVERFLKANDLSVDDVDRWIIHPGGPKIIDAMQAGLGLADAATQPTRDILSQMGNISSAAVVVGLARAIDQRRTGETWLMIGLGPGLSAELVLMKC